MLIGIEKLCMIDKSLVAEEDDMSTLLVNIIFVIAVLVSVAILSWYFLYTKGKVSKKPQLQINEIADYIIQLFPKPKLRVRTKICKFLKMHDNFKNWTIVTLVVIALLTIFNLYVLYGRALEVKYGMPYLFGIKSGYYYFRTFSIPISLVIIIFFVFLGLDFSDEVKEIKEEDKKEKKVIQLNEHLHKKQRQP
ncbi:hypothetical protein PRVXT_002057 [Proteinivorax tanatarense]|uniref:Uncharacterized protein n=1 Tax=Proteinivorax tanatarense TaxID=1260629 RepID=A0AAU7VJN2_9FIRM